MLSSFICYVNLAVTMQNKKKEERGGGGTYLVLLVISWLLPSFLVHINKIHKKGTFQR